MNDKRKRGRPIGSGIDDNAILDRLADLLLREPDLRVATALKKLRRRPSEAEVRRIQAKWQASKSERLQSARDRLAANRRRSTSRHFKPAPSAVAEYFNRIAAIQAAFDSPAVRLARQLNDNPAIRLAQSLQESPALRAVRALEESLALKAIRDFSESPAVRLLEQQRRMVDQMLKVGRI